MNGEIHDAHMGWRTQCCWDVCLPQTELYVHHDPSWYHSRVVCCWFLVFFFNGNWQTHSTLCWKCKGFRTVKIHPKKNKFREQALPNFKANPDNVCWHKDRQIDQRNRVGSRIDLCVHRQLIFYQSANSKKKKVQMQFSGKRALSSNRWNTWISVYNKIEL